MGDEEEPVEVEEPEEDFGGEEGDFDGGEEGDFGPQEESANPMAKCCAGLVLFPFALVLLAYNEVNAVCTAKSINYAVSNAQLVSDCAVPPAEGELIYFSCGVTQANLTTWSESTFLPDSDLLANVTWQAMGSTKAVQFYGCKETRTNTRRRRTSSYTYSYSASWVSASGYSPPSQCTQAEASVECGSDACEEPSGDFGTAFEQKWGTVTLADNFIVESAQLETAFGLTSSEEGIGFENASCESSPTVGCEKVVYSSQSADYLSYFGAAADNLGGLTTMDVPASWGCEAETYSQLIGSSAAMSKDEAGELLLAVNAMVAWILRAIGIMIAILGIYLCLSPIAYAANAMADCLGSIPGVGGCLSDAVEGVADTVLWGISCGVGCIFSLLTIAIFQIYLNPLVGGSLLAVVLCCCCGVVALRKSQGAPKRRPKKNAVDYEGTQLAESPGYQAQTAYQVPMQQPMMAQPMMAQPMMAQPMPQQYQIPVPEGAGPGTVVPFMTADGRQLQAQVPPGMGPGMVFSVAA